MQALVMSDGKDRVKALNDFDEWLNAPLEGWDAVDRRLHHALQLS